MKKSETDQFITQDQYAEMKLEDAKFIFEHAEKQLKDTIENNDLIIARVNTLVTIVAAGMVGLMAYSINRADSCGYQDVLVRSSLFGAIYLYVPSLLIVVNILPKKYAILGSEPKDFFTENLFRKENKESYLKAMYCNEIIQYQKRIKKNKRRNKSRWVIYTITLVLILLTPLVLYLLSTGEFY